VGSSIAVYFYNLVLCCLSAPASGQSAVFLSVRSSFEDQRIFMAVAARQCQVLGIFSPEGQFAVLCSVGLSIETQPILMVAAAVRCYFLLVRGMARSLSKGVIPIKQEPSECQGSMANLIEKLCEMSWSRRMAQETCVSLRSSGHIGIQLSLQLNGLCSKKPNISRHHPRRLPIARAIFRPSTIFKVLFVWNMTQLCVRKRISGARYKHPACLVFYPCATFCLCAT